MRIRSKLLLTFVFLIVLTALFYGLGVYNTISRPILSFEQRNDHQYVRVLAYQLNEILHHAVEDMAGLSWNGFQAYLLDHQLSHLHPHADRFNILRRKFIVNAVLSSPEGIPVQGLHEIPKMGLIPPDRPDEVRIIPFHNTRRPLLRLAHTFYNPDGSLRGRGFIFIDLKRLLQMEIFKGTMTQNSLRVWDPSGTLLFGPRNDTSPMEGKNLILSYIREARLKSGKDLDDPFLTQEIIDGKGKIVQIGAMIPALGLPIFLDPDFFGLETLIRTLERNLLVIGVVISCVAVWLAIFLGRRIVKPVEELNVKAGRIASGEYNARIETRDRDEIGDLARKFNEMADAVERRTQELLETNRKLQEEDAKKTRFLNTVAHDLRTPLTSIKAYSDLLLRFPDEDPGTQKEFLQIILKESDRMAALINDYLDLKKLESGTLQYHFQPIDLVRMIRQIIRIFQGECDRKRIRIVSSLSTPLPSLVADPNRLNQVFSNLLSNAVKFSPTGGEIRIEASPMKTYGTGESTDWVQVSISDQGPGIPEEFHEKIFDKFRQIDHPDSHSKGGTGLGLAITKEIITRHGGKIWVEKERSKGAALTFRIPVTPQILS